mmetsp:Transcript_32456/g.60375  ORF Transcript_32456/g.60375 Transcript_32456/m.60375 type:complete len:80 (-) Transcript_32456:603-842(-)
MTTKTVQSFFLRCRTRIVDSSIILIWLLYTTRAASIGQQHINVGITDILLVVVDVIVVPDPQNPLIQSTLARHDPYDYP